MASQVGLTGEGGGHSRGAIRGIHNGKSNTETFGADYRWVEPSELGSSDCLGQHGVRGIPRGQRTT